MRSAALPPRESAPSPTPPVPVPGAAGSPPLSRSRRLTPNRAASCCQWGSAPLASAPLEPSAFRRALSFSAPCAAVTISTMRAT
eukprot:1177404-Prorocentrum_minimum.AAC.6